MTTDVEAVGESSNRKKPTYLRSFLTTMTVVGAVNLGLFAYFLSLHDDGDIRTGNEWGTWTIKGRVPPDWWTHADIMNRPGQFIQRFCWQYFSRLFPTQVTAVLFSIVVSTVFRGCVAILVEFASHLWKSTRHPNSHSAKDDSQH